MNKRFWELVEQADEQGGDDPDIRDQVFAKLIVRECARVAIAKQTENDIAGIVSKNPAKDFAYALVEHFGVEE